MLFNINEIPADSKPLDVLHWKMIKKIKSVCLKPGSLEGFKEVGWQLVQTCLKEDGIGLAAPQVGLFDKIILCRAMDRSIDNDEYSFKSEFHLYINPDFTPFLEHGKNIKKEHCLSVPNEGFSIERFNKIEINWDEPSNLGEFERKQKILEGWEARLFLHEYDHLNGISIPQRWDLQNKRIKNKKSKSKKRKK